MSLKLELAFFKKQQLLTLDKREMCLVFCGCPEILFPSNFIYHSLRVTLSDVNVL